jgi:indolepyruvate ferredoxin oxidoreductase beta subunit
MTYEDTIRVAAIKVRARRFDRIHKEARAKNEQVVGIMEFLHPQVQEVADTLPTALGKWVLGSKPVNALINRISGDGIKVNTTSAFGYTTLYILSRLRPIRRRSLRFNEEQLLIDAWLTTVMDVATTNYALACEVAETQSLVKGYGETHANGLANFNLIMAELPRTLASADPVARIRQLREAALAEESGARLRALL